MFALNGSTVWCMSLINIIECKLCDINTTNKKCDVLCVCSSNIMHIAEYKFIYKTLKKMNTMNKTSVSLWFIIYIYIRFLVNVFFLLHKTCIYTLLRATRIYK